MTNENGRIDFEQLRLVFAATNGLVLSQVVDYTGVEGSTIQNWVKRGWIAAPKDKKYGEVQVARILILDTLRKAMQLEKIAAIMTYVNGDVEDRSDDIIPDGELYVIFSRAVKMMEPLESACAHNIPIIVDECIGSYCGPHEDSRRRLTIALGIMLMAYLSAELKSQADAAFIKYLTI